MTKKFDVPHFNSTENPLLVSLEPEGSTLVLPAGAQCTVQIEAQGDFSQLDFWIELKPDFPTLSAMGAKTVTSPTSSGDS